MKNLVYKALLAFFLLGTTTYQTKAQVSLSINIGTQPTWGPTGYDRADYYYLPDIESYYSVQSHQFIYLNNGRWIYASNLPPRYGNYDLYSGYKVVVNRPRPYLNFSQDRVQYVKYKGWKGKQTIIRDSRDVRYQRGGNPHGMPPGQAKKYYNDNDHRDNGRGHDDRERDNEHGNGKGHDNGHGKGHGNGRD